MTLHDEMCADHRRLERLFEDLQNAVDGADHPTVQQVWATFESGLLAHLDAEETRLLPRIEAEAADVVSKIRADHTRIRGIVAELGVITDLHVLRKDMAEDLLRSLREHAAYEDRALYPYLDRALPEAEQSAFRRYLEEQTKRLRSRIEARLAPAT